MTVSRRLSTLSPSELLHRHTIVRARLVELGADALIAMGQNNDLGGYARWLTDGTVAYRRTVIVPREAPLTVVDHGPAGVSRPSDGTQPGQIGVGMIHYASTYPSVHYTQAYEGALIGKILREQGWNRIAVVNLAAMPLGFVNALNDGGGITLIDDSDYFDAIKAVKTPVEQEYLREGARIQDEVFARVVKQIRPGMRDCDVAAIGAYEARRLGGQFGIVLAGSARRGELATLCSEDLAGRVLEKGDALSLLIENGSPEGYFLELARPIVLGQAWPELSRAFEKAAAAQAYTINLLQAGSKAADAHAEHCRYMADNGLPVDLRLYSHGQGYDLIERPLMSSAETMTLKPGMCLSVHPAVVEDGAFAFLCDNVLITEQGPVRLHKSEQRIFELETA